MREENVETNEQVPAIALSPDQQKEFKYAVKIGIYKELHKKGLLTDAQLITLIEMQKEKV